MALGKPAIPSIRSGDDRGLATAIQNIRQRLEAIESLLNVLSSGGLASLQTTLAQLNTQVNSLVLATGTVTSVAATVPDFMGVAGTPITGAGTLAFTFNDESPNLVLASPNGTTGAPSFRALEWYYDMPLFSTAPGISGLDGSELLLIERYGNFYWTTVDAVASRVGTATSVCLAIACSDESSSLTAGTNKVRFINPYSTAFIVTAVVGSLNTAQTSGSTFTVDINENGTSILSTKLTIDNGEKTSGTAAVPPVISDASIAPYAEIEVDIDTVGDGTAAGLKVYLIGHPS